MTEDKVPKEPGGNTARTQPMRQPARKKGCLTSVPYTAVISVGGLFVSQLLIRTVIADIFPA